MLALQLLVSESSSSFSLYSTTVKINEKKNKINEKGSLSILSL